VSPPGRAQLGAEGAALALVLVVAAWARLAAFGEVLAGGELIPLDGDSAYHLRRMELTARSFPFPPAFDPWLAWPDGGLVPWADGFDVLLAGTHLAAGGADAPGRAALAVALVPVVLGLLVVWATMDLARLVAGGGRAGTSAAAAAGLLVAVLPQAVATARLGRTDHHVAEVLAMLLLAGWVLRRWPGPEGGAAVAFELAGALAAAFAVWTFAGGTLYVGIAAAVLAAVALASPPAPLAGSGAPGLALGALLALVLGWPAAAARGLRLEFAAPSLLQPLLLGLGALLVAGAAGVARLRPAASTRARLGLLAAAGAAAALACAVALPALGRELRAGLVEFVLRRDPWLAGIDEFQPLLAGGEYRWLHRFYGVVGYLAPVLLTAGALAAVRAARARGIAFAAVLAALAVLAVLQTRFGRVFAPFLAVATGAALAAAAAAAERAWASLSRLAAALPLAAVGAAVAFDPGLAAPLRFHPPGPPAPAVAAALDLRGVPALRGGAGVLAPWDLGHMLSRLAGAPAAATGFGPFVGARSFEESEAALARGPDGLEETMERRRLAVLVAGTATLRLPGPRGEQPLKAAPGGGVVLDPDYLRAVPAAAALVGGSAVPRVGLRHLPHLLPRFASEQAMIGLGSALPVLWTYERVKGAVLRGRAPPGARVVASLPLVEHGRPHLWRAFTDAAADGTWELTLPVPTDLARPTVVTGARLELRAADGPPVEIALPEAAVQAGDVVPVPDLRAPE
jgi:hypothetical protein